MIISKDQGHFRMKYMIIFVGLLLVLSGCSNHTLDGEKMGKTAVFETNKGNFEIELFTEKAPITTKNFIELADKGF